MDTLQDISRSFQTEYKKTPTKLKVTVRSKHVSHPSMSLTTILLQILDCFLLYAILTGAVQVIMTSVASTVPKF